MLSVPIKHSKKNLKRKFSDIEIDNDQDWLKNHFKSIKISYQSSPYYEFYEQEINNFFKNKTKKLYVLNLKSIQLISKLLNISLSDDFIETKDNLTDLSNLSYKKKSEIKVERYHQTFEDKNGFINDLLGVSPYRVYMISLQPYLYILSVALFLLFQAMGVTHCNALWCPDFPL